MNVFKIKSFDLFLFWLFYCFKLYLKNKSNKQFPSNLDYVQFSYLLSYLISHSYKKFVCNVDPNAKVLKHEKNKILPKNKPSKLVVTFLNTKFHILITKYFYVNFYNTLHVNNIIDSFYPGRYFNQGIEVFLGKFNQSLK